jgi:hypothetical protein
LNRAGVRTACRGFPHHPQLFAGVSRADGIAIDGARRKRRQRRIRLQGLRQNPSHAVGERNSFDPQDRRVLKDESGGFVDLNQGVGGNPHGLKGTGKKE